MKRLFTICALIGAILCTLAAPAIAAPVFNLDMHHAPSNFTPGGNPGETVVTTKTQGASPATNEVQEVRIFAGRGLFRLGLGAETTIDLPVGASAAAVDAALEALPSIGPSGVSVTFIQVVPMYVITFTGALASTDVPQITLSEGSAPLRTDPEYWFDVENVGETATSGLITLTVKLPNGIRRAAVRTTTLATPLDKDITWSCPGTPGDATVTCTTNDSIPRHSSSSNLALVVSVTAPAGSDRFASASVSGGGAAPGPTVFEQTHIDDLPAGFGILPETFVPDFFEADGLTPVRQAGAHPFMFTIPFDFTTVDRPTDKVSFSKAEADSVRSLSVDTPPGFIGNPTAVGECSAADLTLAACPASSQVGTAYVKTTQVLEDGGTVSNFRQRVFNMSHPRGAVSDLAFVIFGNPIHIKVSLDPANRYAITSRVPDINETLPPFTQRVRLWGVPGDKRHDSERCPAYGDGGKTEDTSQECSTDGTKPFLTVPSECGAEHAMRMHHYDSWQNTGVFGPEVTYTQPGVTTDCDRPRFEPDVAVVPTGKQANTPTGLDVHIKVAQNENPDALATPPVKRVEVRLPEGMSFSPSFADGLQSCTLAQMKLFTNDPIACPDASRIGEVELHSPLLPKSLEGSMYLAAQRDNPSNSTFALLLVLEDVEERGILVKIPGRIDVDPATGQIVTLFEDTPQFPFDDMTLKFRSGPRAPLVSPPNCGTQTIGIEVTSYAQPQDPVDVSNTYQVTEGPNGAPCPPEVNKRPFAPKFSAGTLNPVAGAYSTFLFRLSREDQEQELTGIKTVLPPGLVGRIAGMSFCSEQAIGSISTAEFTGRNELSNPACPASSEFGSISAGLGAGPSPNYFNGKVYLAGPYKGAPLSLVVVAPGIAGPFDLGNVVVRAALHVNPETAQVTAISDPFPAILHGVILRTRDVRLRLDKPQRTINPTNCSRMSVDGQVSGAGGAIFDAQVPFQVGSCGDLNFEPKLELRLFGGTKRGAHPKLRATLKMPPGGANIGAASVALPKSEFLDQGHIKTICTRVQFAAEACPSGSIYGTVTAKTPLLDETLSGPIYLRSSNNSLPDIVAAFRGGKIDANVIGRVDSVNGGIRNTFDFVPDVPVTEATFNFFGGKKGLLVNSRNICKGTFRATARFTGQNGARRNWKPKMQARCGKSGKAKRR